MFLLLDDSFLCNAKFSMLLMFFFNLWYATMCFSSIHFFTCIEWKLYCLVLFLFDLGIRVSSHSLKKAKNRYA